MTLAAVATGLLWFVAGPQRRWLHAGSKDSVDHAHGDAQRAAVGCM
jgi:hypothetical protein